MWQRREPPCISLRSLKVRRDYLRRIGSSCRILSERKESGNGRRLRVLQVQRVEIEPKKHKQGCGQNYRGESTHKNGYAPTLQKIVHRGELGKSHLVRLIERTNNPQQSRQQRDARQECNDHSGPGSLSNFRQAAIAGGQE